MDMINCEMRQKDYSGLKRRFPATKYLDRLCKNPLYITYETQPLSAARKFLSLENAD